MKKALSAAVVFGLLFISCQSEENTEKSSESSEESVKKDEIDLARFQEMAVEPCNLFTEELVTSSFDVKAEELELEKHSSKKGKISQYSFCRYLWKKPNYDEILKRITEKMIEAAKVGDSKNSMDVAINLEKSKFIVGVANLKVYDDKEEAIDRFKMGHKIPEKKDLEQLNKTIDEKAEGVLKEEEKETGKDIAGGIASNMKFEKVEGIGDMAYWDYMSDRLDILYGTIQIGIIMHISEDHEENIAAAKKFSDDIMNGF